MRVERYRVSCWDSDTDQFEHEFTVFNRWSLRLVIRKLEAEGWSDVTILVERID